MEDWVATREEERGREGDRQTKKRKVRDANCGDISRSISYPCIWYIKNVTSFNEPISRRGSRHHYPRIRDYMHSWLRPPRRSVGLVNRDDDLVLANFKQLMIFNHPLFRYAFRDFSMLALLRFFAAWWLIYICITGNVHRRWSFLRANPRL